MSLFGNLPPPTSHLRPKQGSIEEEYKPLPEPADAHEGSGQPGPGDDRPDKRRRVESGGDGGLSSEQVVAALRKIASHISNPDKFPKAAGLMRQLLDSGALGAQHREPLFEAIKAAFSDFDACSEPGLRRDYMKLVHILDRRAEQLLSRQQLAQLSVYRLVGFTQNEMHTDDSFVFNKVLGRIKEAVAELPPATEEDEEAHAELMPASSSDDSGDEDDDDGRRGRERRRRGDGDRGSGGADAPGAGAEDGPSSGAPDQGEAAGGAAAAGGSGGGGAAADEDYDEADPFGLDRLIPQPAAPPPPPPAAAATAAPEAHRKRGGGAAAAASTGGGVWTAAQCRVMRRQALIECLITARGFHKTPWARTGVELLVEHYARHRDRFTAAQQLAVDEMVRFVRSARAARPTGPSQKEINRDVTSFERARAEWSRVAVSARGKVGAQGDAKTQNWLG